MGQSKKNNKKKPKIPQNEKDMVITESDTLIGKHDEDTMETDFNEDRNEISGEKIMKRPHEPIENADTDDEPKKSKKKKTSEVDGSTTTGKKNKKSKRQIKKEKYAERLAAEQASAKDQIKLQCLNYLSQWKHDRQNWKFMKARQVWLQKNKFSTQLIPEASWPVLLEYFESAKGNIKNILLDDANKIIKQMDEWTESQTNQDADCDTEQAKSTDLVKPDESIYNRARSIIQCLQE